MLHINIMEKKMDKKKLVYNESKEEYKAVSFQGQVISVKTRLNIEDISKLMSTYLLEYFNENEPIESRTMLAEYSFKSMLFELVSDYTISDEIFYSVANTSLLEDVSNLVDNLYEVEDLIFKTIQKMQSENQTSNKLSSLVDKIYELIENFSSMTVDEDFINKVTSAAKEIKELGIQKEVPQREAKDNENVSS